MDKRKPHPFEEEVDRTLTELQADLKTMKQIFSTGIMYNFNFNQIPSYIALPEYVTYSNVVRIEFTVATMSELDAGRLIHAIGLDLDMNNQAPIRAIPRLTKRNEVNVVLQIVGQVDWFQQGFLAQMILNGAELAEHYRATLIIGQNEAA